jgi:hypothetical protein
MLPSILILEARREIADALADVVASANYAPIVRPYIDRLADLGVTPAAIIVRIAFEGVSEPPHAALERLHPNRPPIVAIARQEVEIAEAVRLRCEIVLRAPDDVGRLCDALTRLVHA